MMISFFFLYIILSMNHAYTSFFSSSVANLVIRDESYLKRKANYNKTRRRRGRKRNLLRRNISLSSYQLSTHTINVIRYFIILFHLLLVVMFY